MRSETAIRSLAFYGYDDPTAIAIVELRDEIEDHSKSSPLPRRRCGAGLSNRGATWLKAAIAGDHPFKKNDRHFSAEGHALFAKFVIDTELARPPSTITSSIIEPSAYQLSHHPLCIDSTRSSQFDIVNAAYLRVRAFAWPELSR